MAKKPGKRIKESHFGPTRDTARVVGAKPQAPKPIAQKVQSVKKAGPRGR